MPESEIKTHINGKEFRFHCHPLSRLTDAIRDEANLTGTKIGCGEGECGACAVIMDGTLVNSCLIPAREANGKKIVTIEGLENGLGLSPLQNCFLEKGGAQCGICTPGMILAAKTLLENHQSPNREDIIEGISGNLCRCTGYVKIIDSIEAASKLEKNQ